MDGFSVSLRLESSAVAAVRVPSQFPICATSLSSSAHTFHFRSKFLKLPSNSIRKYCSCSSTQTPKSAPLFLPFLETLQTQHPENSDQHDDDPLVRFFKSRPPEPDPNSEGKMSLKRNRRSSWHLASTFDSQQESENDDTLFTSHGNGEIVSEMVGVVGEILEVARALPKNDTIGEALENHDFEGRLREEDCVEVLRVLSEENNVLGCLYFFEWMGSREPCLVSPKACSVLFPFLGKVGKGDEMLVIFNILPLKKNKQFRDVRVYNSALTGLLLCKRYEDAWKVYKLMEESNIQPDHVTASIMITVMRKKGDSAKDAWEFFEELDRNGIKCWSLESVGALIKSFGDEGLRKEALIIQSELEKQGVSSNVVIYNTLMDSYSKSNQVEEAEGLFAEMKLKGITPTTASYNILMDAYSKRLQPEIVETLLREMETVGLEPNVISYTCLINAYGKQKKMSEMAADAFLRMKKAGIKPSSHSYTALVHAYSVSGWHEKASIAFTNMLRDGLRPSIETYTALLDAHRRAGDTETLMKIWKTMMRSKVGGTQVTFNILLDGFSKQGCYVEARDVIHEFGKLGYHPTVLTYNMLMNAYARGGQESKLPQLLKEMVVLGLKPDSVTYSTMIYAYIRVRDFRRAFFYHKKMVESGQVPDSNSYKKMREILDEKAKIKNRRDKNAVVGIVRSSMGVGKLKRRGKKDEFWKNRKSLPGNRSSPPSPRR